MNASLRFGLWVWMGIVLGLYAAQFKGYVGPILALLGLR